MIQVGNIIEERKQQLTVNSTVNSYKDINNTVNSFPVKEEYEDLETKTDDLLLELSKKPEYVANRLARELDDLKSEQYFLILAKNNEAQRLFEALSYTQTASREGKIHTKKAIYFLGILRRWGIKINFKK